MEKKFPFLSLWPFILGFLLLGLLPDIANWLITPEGLVYRGSYVNVDDVSVYLSAIRQGGEGQWLFRPSFSPEIFPSYLSFMPYLMVGKLSMFLGGSSLFWFNLLRIASVIFAMYSLHYWFLTVFPNSVRLQKTGLLFAIFGSGFGWILAGFIQPSSPLLADMNTPEWNLLLNFLAAPHFVLGAGLIALYFAQLQRMVGQRPSNKLTIATFLSTLALSLSYPYLIPIIGLTSGLLMIFLAVQKGKTLWRIWRHLLFALIPGVASLIYYGIYLPTDPIWKISLTQNNSIPSPHPLGLIFGFGLLGIFAILGSRYWSRSKLSILPLIWLIVHLLVVYLPISYAGRFTTGLFIPICTIAAYGLEAYILPQLQSSGFYIFFSKLSPTPYESLRRAIIILTIPTTWMVSFWSMRSAFSEPSYPFYYPVAEVEAVEWLGEHTSDSDLILVHYAMGNHLPRYSDARIFLGHFDLTIDVEEKFELSRQFWNSATSNEWREEFVGEWEITYIYQGEYENVLSDTAIIPPGTIVFQNQSATIYAIDVK